MRFVPRFRPSTYVYLAIAIAASAPAWIVRYPPIQDLPFHLATIRVIRSLNDPFYGLAEHFTLTLGRTQYVLYYLLGAFLSYFVGVLGANVVLMSCYLGGTLLAMRDLLRALGKDERLCLFSIPLVYNVMFMFGLFPFLLGIPIMLWALATAVRYVEKPTRDRGILLAVLAMALFYSHIFPFGIFGIGFMAIFPWNRPKRWIRAGLPTVPALLMMAWWTLGTEAGKLTRGALTDSKNDPIPPLTQSIPGAFGWLTDIFRDTSDEAILVATFVAAILCVGLAQGDREKSKPISRAYVLLPLACVFLYFNTSEGHGYIWLIAQRFPIMFLITAIPLLRMPTGSRGWAASAGVLAVGLASTVNVCKHYIKFQLEEVGDIDGAIDVMEPGKKVAALIYDRNSAVAGWAPFLHFGSYYQLKKGGVVMFTYAGYLHWPFDFKPGKYPPPGGPARLRWEWTPESVRVQGELYPYYDYVLTRGNGFHPPQGTFHLKWRGEKWQVWERS
jgi:hypothetical protein